ncbi:hypothetical protein CKO50_07475 [Pseudoalteromonas sp. HM-SA03]|uniref:hypothetical protein n=1 Tax=Pseudoalteromonas sp. HM-SA03 TaxID=2029678 RepID=UPI000BAE5139|nr:hypothetical protein [Pseudoalteromonas sp. HM-SA03]PAY01902.1 hypothetical protein CKO50_07475 [Pseudoalteromonas sp. HM-SA03]
MKYVSLTLVALASVALFGCNDEQTQGLTNTTLMSAQTTAPYKQGDDIPATAFMQHNEVYNAESVIPPQCYTKTDGVNNPCYACHQSYDEKNRPNMMRDANLQGAYEFSDLGFKNHWKNLFKDRSELIKGISDQDITNWVNQDNYTPFIEKLKNNPDWKGEITPLNNLAYPEKAFDDQGIAKDGSGWVAFNYKPFPSTFWPTNGSTGDVMIRLADAFREKGETYNQDVYLANLSLVEMAVKGLDEISTPVISESRVGVDLNGDGKLTQITNMLRSKRYLGDANTIELAHQLYPQDTEFLHTVRYIGVDDNGQVFNAPRMKEVRYMKKHNFKSKQSLGAAYYREAKEKSFENYPQTLYLGDQGINNNFGWTINGYIEDKNGALRPQHEQELAFCNGCHKTIGSTYDQTFSFARKVEGKLGWGYINLKEMQDVPNKGEEQGEFLTYMMRVGGGDEFRQNQEMLMRWFNEDGTVNSKKVQSAKNLYELITPSKPRALALNKAYLTIVKEQSYLFGRDATIVKARNVLEQVDDSQQPLEAEHRYVWDMQLDWNKAE